MNATEFLEQTINTINQPEHPQTAQVKMLRQEEEQKTTTSQTTITIETAQWGNSLGKYKKMMGGDSGKCGYLAAKLIENIFQPNEQEFEEITKKAYQQGIQQNIKITAENICQKISRKNSKISEKEKVKTGNHIIAIIGKESHAVPVWITKDHITIWNSYQTDETLEQDKGLLIVTERTQGKEKQTIQHMLEETNIKEKKEDILIITPIEKKQNIKKEMKKKKQKKERETLTKSTKTEETTTTERNTRKQQQQKQKQQKTWWWWLICAITIMIEIGQTLRQCMEKEEKRKPKKTEIQSTITMKKRKKRQKWIKNRKHTEKIIKHRIKEINGLKMTENCGIKAAAKLLAEEIKTEEYWKEHIANKITKKTEENGQIWIEWEDIENATEKIGTIIWKWTKDKGIKIEQKHAEIKEKNEDWKRGITWGGIKKNSRQKMGKVAVRGKTSKPKTEIIIVDDKNLKERADEKGNIKMYTQPMAIILATQKEQIQTKKQLLQAWALAQRHKTPKKQRIQTTLTRIIGEKEDETEEEKKKRETELYKEYKEATAQEREEIEKAHIIIIKGSEGIAMLKKQGEEYISWSSIKDEEKTIYT